MCQSSIHHYNLRRNLTNWGWTYLLNSILTHIAFGVDDVLLIWVSAVVLGVLSMWALEMCREWLKVNLTAFHHPIS